MKVAFYRAEYGNWQDKLIAWWTSSEYSHVEVIIGELWYSSSPREGKVRCREMVADHKWDVIDVDVIADVDTLRFIRGQLGKKYDWLGIILTQLIPLGIQDRGKWFCSEFCSAVLKKAGCERLTMGNEDYSPGSLYGSLR